MNGSIDDRMSAPTAFYDDLRADQEDGFGPTNYQIAILIGLNKLGKHVFGGITSRHSTESPRATRRRKARVVKTSRRANRG